MNLNSTRHGAGIVKAGDPERKAASMPYAKFPTILWYNLPVKNKIIFTGVRKMDIKDLKVSINCPACKKKFEYKLRDIFPEKKIVCPSCKASITFEGDDMHKSIDGFSRDIKNLSKRFKITG